MGIYQKNKHLLLVIGGRGFVGSNILQRAIQKGIAVRSLNPSGRPDWEDLPWLDKVQWVQGDVFDTPILQHALSGITGVISTVGAYASGSSLSKGKAVGEATVVAAQRAAEAGVQRFVFISNARVGSQKQIWKPLDDYLRGKERAEAAVLKYFPETGVCLRPGYINGWRRSNPYTYPFQLASLPITFLARECGTLSNMLTQMPVLGKELQAAVKVNDVAKAAILSAIGQVPMKIIDTSNIIQIANSFHDTL